MDNSGLRLRALPVQGREACRSQLIFDLPRVLAGREWPAETRRYLSHLGNDLL
jgi:hypothetical protein